MSVCHVKVSLCGRLNILWTFPLPSALCPLALFFLAFPPSVSPSHSHFHSLLLLFFTIDLPSPRRLLSTSSPLHHTNLPRHQRHPLHCPVSFTRTLYLAIADTSTNSSTRPKSNPARNALVAVRGSVRSVSCSRSCLIAWATHHRVRLHRDSWCWVMSM